MHDTLNFFDPNPDIPAYYENQLTRAFLVVLRLSPAAHLAWLSLVAPERKLYQLSRPWEFDTQRWRVFETTPDVAEPVEGISVLQAADAEGLTGPVAMTDRAQVLDGIVRYGDELVIVVETKLGGRVCSDQAQYLNVHGSPVRFAADIRTVSWRQLLAAWYDLVEKEVATGVERAIIVDFLDYVERHFQNLGPFATIGRCKGNGFRITRRLEAVLDEIAGGASTKSWLELPGRVTVSRAILQLEEPGQRIRLGLYPADTLTQAKRFYERTNAVDGVLSLRQSGWEVRPNFHFGFMASGLVWTTTEAPVEEYVDYWGAEAQSTRQVERKDWEELWEELLCRRFATQDNKAQFDQDFTNAKRPTATPRPGLACHYYWSLAEVEKLDDAGRFVTAVAEQVNACLGMLGETPLGLPAATV
ncbi:MAG: hypothetical protein WCP21_17270 [Armatimonadota bacterium]